MISFKGFGREFKIEGLVGQIIGGYIFASSVLYTFQLLVKLVGFIF